jgi:light-regulated signal transduction histidine kinase (bacteriophytochrome)
MREIRHTCQPGEATALTAPDAEWAIVRDSFERLLSAAPHEMVGPLNQASSLIGIFAERRQNGGGEEAESLLAFLEAAAERMQATVGALRAWFDITSPHYERVPVNMNQVFGTALIYLDREITRTQAVIDCVELPEVLGDTSALANLFQILISNSLKFKRPGIPPKIEISCALQETGWIFSVTDNGIGIDPAQCDRLFQPFKKLHGQDYRGAGMGLANARTIVALHHGSIWVEPRYGEGACLSFRLGAAP